MSHFVVSLTPRAHHNIIERRCASICAAGDGQVSGTIDAFTMDQAAKLSGLSEDQLRSWDTAGLFRPSLGWEDRRRHYSRIYTFEDLVALRTLARLREEGV